MADVIVFGDDLMFLSRIREVARSAGVEVRPVRRVTDLGAAVGEGSRLVLVDADSDRLPWTEALGALRDDPSRTRVSVVAFLSHVRAERAAAAREAGCDRVLARSAFVRELPDLLAAAARGRPLLEDDAS
jgi:CheY-like chemotaxis protein